MYSVWPLFPPSPLLSSPSLSDFKNYVQNSVEIYVKQHPTFRDVSHIKKKKKRTHKKCAFLANKLLNALTESGKLSHLKYFWLSSFSKHTEAERVDQLVHLWRFDTLQMHLLTSVIFLVCFCHTFIVVWNQEGVINSR